MILRSGVGILWTVTESSTDPPAVPPTDC